jgi:hypothetical protein
MRPSRATICSRNREGLARAKTNDVKMGRTCKLADFQRCEAIRRRYRDDGEAIAEIGGSYDVSGATISRFGP